MTEKEKINIARRELFELVREQAVAACNEDSHISNTPMPYLP